MNATSDRQGNNSWSNTCRVRGQTYWEKKSVPFFFSLSFTRMPVNIDPRLTVKGRHAEKRAALSVKMNHRVFFPRTPLFLFSLSLSFISLDGWGKKIVNTLALHKGPPRHRREEDIEYIYLYTCWCNIYCVKSFSVWKNWSILFALAVQGNHRDHRTAQCININIYSDVWCALSVWIIHHWLWEDVIDFVSNYKRKPTRKKRKGSRTSAERVMERPRSLHVRSPSEGRERERSWHAHPQLKMICMDVSISIVSWIISPCLYR